MRLLSRYLSDLSQFPLIKNINLCNSVGGSKNNSGFFHRQNPCQKKACVLLASGTEEMECVIVTDVLRRAGVHVDLASVDICGAVVCQHKVVILPEMTIETAMKNRYDILVLPGGIEGSECFSKSKEVGDFLRLHEADKKFIGAICAAPLALRAHCIHFGKTLTSYPTLECKVNKARVYKYSDCTVVWDGKLITSRGPGTAVPFALTLVHSLLGFQKAREIAKDMLLCYEYHEH